jgi:hypothetical protein
MESEIFKEEVQAQKDSEKKAENEFKTLLEDFKRTFETVNGKRVYKHLLERCHVFSTTFTGNSKTFFLEGERNIGLYLLSMREMATVESLEKLKEAIKE